MSDLKPCPVCRSTDIRTGSMSGGHNWPIEYVECVGCGIRGPLGFDYVEKWNALPRHRPVAPRYQLQTTYGFYPSGTWGCVSQSNDLDQLLANFGESGEYRIVDNRTGEIVYPLSDTKLGSETTRSIGRG